MSLFVKKQRPQTQKGSPERRPQASSLNSRLRERPVRQSSDRDILMGMTAQAASRTRSRAGDAAERNTRVDWGTRVPWEGAQVRNERIVPRPAPDEGNTFIRPRQPETPDPAAGAAQAGPRPGAAGSTDAQPAQGGQTAQVDDGFEFTPVRPSLFRRALAKANGLIFLILGTAALVLCLVGVYKGSLALYSWLHTSETFVTRHVDITGNVRLNRDIILRLAGLREGDNVFSVSVADMERRLRETPWVADVSVQRVLPDRFVISLQERMPSFWIRRENRLFYANEKGEPIAPVESENFMSLPILTVDPGCEDALPYLSRLWKDLRTGVLPIEPGAVATVDISPSRGISLFLEDREMILSLSPDNWEGNFARLGVTFSDLARRRELARVQELRVADGRVWVVLRSVAQ